MKSIKDPTELTHFPYRARGVVMARKKPGILVHNQPSPPVEAEDLIYRGGHTWSAMSYKTFYLGKVWTEAARVASVQTFPRRSEEHTSELQSRFGISYA